jgi:mannose-6-phosphate isomerase-like protein (cupin superfamily)
MNYESNHLSKMTRGWFVGDFSPTMLATDDVEVAVQHYCAGDYEPAHHHRIATEITVILDGEAEMSGKVFRDGDIIRIPPGSTTDFRAITDLKTVVVKYPGAKNDKYIS